MGRRHMASYELQSFETRRGECRIEGGVIYIQEGPTRTIRRTLAGIREGDFEAFKKPAMVAFMLFGVATTAPGVFSALADGSTWALVGGLAIAVGVVGQLLVWLRRWLLDPSEIRCSDVESVTRVGDDTLRIEYKEGPRRTDHDLKLPRTTTDERWLATRAFEEKGFEVERDEREQWYRNLV
ncbi:MAG: hypothetical protein QXG03_05455 [Halalkalicoccus sp.]